MAVSLLDNKNSKKSTLVSYAIKQNKGVDLFYYYNNYNCNYNHNHND